VPDTVTTAWNIHSALLDWTAKVDGKAAFAIGLESGALGLAVALSASDRTFSDMGILATVIYLIGIVTLLAASSCALLAVYPRLRTSLISTEVDENYIYFGHLRQWDAKDLAIRLEAGSDLVDVLARQCVRMADVAWRKHRLVQLSLGLGEVGITMLVVCALLATL
jgi:hypothetical protein